MAIAWPFVLGAVYPALVAPSLLIADPRITARMGSPSRKAALKGLSTTPSPEPKTVPPARTSKGRVDPSGEYIPLSLKRYPARDGTRTDTPPARAIWHSPFARLRHAM